jgi:hypothetical protein
VAGLHLDKLAIGTHEVDDLALDGGLEPAAGACEAFLELGVEAVLGVKVDSGALGYEASDGALTAEGCFSH